MIHMTMKMRRMMKNLKKTIFILYRNNFVRNKKTGRFYMVITTIRRNKVIKEKTSIRSIHQAKYIQMTMMKRMMTMNKLKNRKRNIGAAMSVIQPLKIFTTRNKMSN